MSNTKIWTLWKDEKINDEETRLLRRLADEIPIPFDDEGKKDIKTLVNAFLERDDAYGLAAPQIGISKRIVAFRSRGLNEGTRIKSERDYDVLVNPRITQSRGEKEKTTEGCLSCPEINVEVSRFPEIKVRAYDVHGNKINKRYTGFLARIVQHELDHLEGKLIIDHEGVLYYPRKKQEFFEKLFSNK
jgi:peptide deformylase